MSQRAAAIDEAHPRVRAHAYTYVYTVNIYPTVVGIPCARARRLVPPGYYNNSRLCAARCVGSNLCLAFYAWESGCAFFFFLRGWWVRVFNAEIVKFRELRIYREFIFKNLSVYRENFFCSFYFYKLNYLLDGLKVEFIFSWEMITFSNC